MASRLSPDVPLPMHEFHVSPRGDDRAAGSASRPWATLAGARDQLRALRASGKVEGLVTVHVHDGTYEQKETVAFNDADSHTRFAAARGAKPVFDGSERLTGWKVGDRNGRVVRGGTTRRKLSPAPGSGIRATRPRPSGSSLKIRSWKSAPVRNPKSNSFR